MKYLDTVLKATCIGLYLADLSGTASTVAFGLYCLLQQSSKTQLSFGAEPSYFIGCTERTKQYEAYIKEKHKGHKGNYSLSTITEAILETQPSSKINKFELYNLAKQYRDYLAFKGVRISESSKPHDLDQSIVYLVFFVHKKTLDIPTQFASEIQSTIESTRNATTQELAKPIIYSKGYPRHLQLVICHYESKSGNREDDGYDVMLQIGNQYKVQARMSQTAYMYYAACILLPIGFSYVLPLQYSFLSFIIMLCQASFYYTPEDYICVHLGHDPRSSASTLFSVSPDSGNLVYSYGTVSLNIFINLVLFFLLGTRFNCHIITIPLYPLIGLCLATIYDRYKLSTSKSYTPVTLKDTDGSIIDQRMIPGFEIPNPIGVISKPHSAISALIRSEQ